MVRQKKIKVPTRAEGDSTGQTQMLQEQIDSVQTPQAPGVQMQTIGKITYQIRLVFKKD